MAPYLASGQGQPSLFFSSTADLVAYRIPSIATKLSALVGGNANFGIGTNGGTFFYVASSSLATNTTTIFKPAASNGRWINIRKAFDVNAISINGSDVASNITFIYQNLLNLTNNVVSNYVANLNGKGTNIDINGGNLSGPLTGASNNISFISTGSTTSRPLANRASDTINILDFGAIGDTNTDNTVAIQAAIDRSHLSNGITVFIPSGNFYTKQLKVYQNTRLSGEGKESSILSLVDPVNTVGILSSDELTPIRNLYFQDLSLTVPASGTAIKTALRLKNVGYSLFENCRFNMSGTNLTDRIAIDIDGNLGTANTYYNVFSGCQFVNNYISAYIHGSANANAFVDGNVFLENIYGITTSNSVHVVIANNSFQNLHGGIGVNIVGDATSEFNTIEGNYFEDMDYGIYMAPLTQFNFLHGNSYSVMGIRSYLNDGTNVQNISETGFRSFFDTGQFAQFMKLYKYSSPSFPSVSSNYDNAIFGLPQSSTNDAAATIQLTRQDGSYEMVPFAMRESFYQLTDGDTQPSVRLRKFIRTFNTVDTTITNFLGGFPGQEIKLLVIDTHTSLLFGATNYLRGNLGNTYKCSNKDLITAKCDDNGIWYCNIIPASTGFSVTAGNGVTVTGKTGTSTDFAILRPSLSLLMDNPTGTPDARFYGTLSVQGNANQKIYSGSGSPEGVVAASFGSVYQSSSGGFGTTFYVKNSNSGGNTGWSGVGSTSTVATNIANNQGTTTTVLHGNASGAPSFGAVSLANDVTGNLGVSHLNSGTSASSSTFWRGDGTWATPSGGGGSGTVTNVDGTANEIAITQNTTNPIVAFAGGHTGTGKVMLNNQPLIEDGAQIWLSGNYFGRLGTYANVSIPLTATGFVGETNVFLGVDSTSEGLIIRPTLGAEFFNVDVKISKNLTIPSSTGNARAGNAILVGGTVTVGNTSVTANTIVMLTRKTIGGTVGNTSYTVSAGSSFTISSSSGTDTSTYSYLLIEAP